MNTQPLNELAQADPNATPPELPDIESAWRDAKRKRIKQFPCNNLRASSVGHPCARNLYHSVKDWRERVLHDEILQSIFDEGHLHEVDVMRQLSGLGFEVVEQQRAFQIDKPLITGQIDGKLRYKGKVYPFDVKSIGAYDFPKITTSEDLTCSKKVHQRNYVAQMQLYLLMANEELGFLLFKNKLTGQIKTVWMQIDFAFCETILKKAELVYVALAKGVPPERCNELDLCIDCPYRHICLPDLAMGPGVVAIDDAELSALLERRGQLEASAKEFKTIDEDVKDVLKGAGIGDRICGQFLCRTSEHERKNKIAETWHEEISKYFRTQIVKLEK